MKVSVHQTDRFTFGHDACDVLGGQEIITGSFGNP